MEADGGPAVSWRPLPAGILRRSVHREMELDIEIRVGALLRGMWWRCKSCGGRKVIVVSRGGWKGKPVLKPCEVCC